MTERWAGCKYSVSEPPSSRSPRSRGPVGAALTPTRGCGILGGRCRRRTWRLLRAAFEKFLAVRAASVAEVLDPEVEWDASDRCWTSGVLLGPAGFRPFWPTGSTPGSPSDSSRLLKRGDRVVARDTGVGGRAGIRYLSEVRPVYGSRDRVDVHWSSRAVRIPRRTAVRHARRPSSLGLSSRRCRRRTLRPCGNLRSFGTRVGHSHLAHAGARRNVPGPPRTVQ